MTTHDDALREAEARLGSAVAYVEYRATADVEGLDEIIDAAIEVGRLRERAEERRNLMTESDALREARARLWQAREDADDVVYRGDMSPEEVCEYQDRREAAAIEVGRLRALAEANEHRQCQVCGAIDGEQHGWEHDEIRTALREAGQS